MKLHKNCSVNIFLKMRLKSSFNQNAVTTPKRRQYFGAKKQKGSLLWNKIKF